MKLYFAPLEGITDGVYISAHKALFSGIDKYFTPFISVSPGFNLSKKEDSLISFAARNPGICSVQLLGRDASHLKQAIGKLSQAGIFDIDLNLGCPSGTVTAKGKGSGLLRSPDALKKLLDDLFASPLASHFSVKTRIGYESSDEWPRLAEILFSYPFSEIIIHARTRTQFYKGKCHTEIMDQLPLAGIPVIFNGDIFTPSAAKELMSLKRPPDGIMLGRGIVANPALAEEILGLTVLDKSRLKRFFDALLFAFSESMPFNALHGRMCEIMSYMGVCLDGSKKYLKRLRKAKARDEYISIAEEMLYQLELSSQPYFDPLSLSESGS
ncbi:MAG: tRNA-dihydrouridine synthase family protein [Clostridiales bacterium]|nr:tRNA-dihydrouridine synthase family protein [Clostridiales bacterium]